MPNFFEQYDPTKPGGAENILTGGSVAPWNAGKGAFKNNAKYDPYNPDPANFQDPNLAGALAGYGQGIQNAQGRQGPQANPYWQQGNMNLANQLASLGSGQGPSIAGAQFDLGHQSGLASNAAMAASGSSAGNPALASRMRRYRLSLGFQGGTFDLNANGQDLPGRVSAIAAHGLVIGGDIPLPFGGFPQQE